jgi:anti-sigma regulatory factor (Ser/Thr protein kinase)
MTRAVNRVRIFAASPGDTQEERDRLATVVAELNKGIAAERDLALELVRWETHTRPGMGSDPQDVINRQLPEADIVIAMFWKRLGTPTPRADSGTAEELESAIEEWRLKGEIEILAYFNQSPYTPDREELDQVQRLLGFRQTLESRGLFPREYNGVPDFEAQVRQHLTDVVLAWDGGAKPSTAAPPESAMAEWSIPSPGQVDAEIDATRPSDVQTLVSDLRALLTEKGFGGPSANRTATVMLELLANVREHAPSPRARVQIEISTGTVFCAVVTVIQEGPAFDLDVALEAGRRAYQTGDHEHGLVKVARLAGDLRLINADGQVGLACTVFDLAGIGSGVFDKFGFVTAATLELDLPKRWILGQDVYVGRDIEVALQFALSEPAPRLLDLYFAELRIPNDGYLGIEFVGNVLPSEVGPMRIAEEISQTYPAPRSDTVIEAAFEVQFKDLFESQRVVMHAFETGFMPTTQLQHWAALWNLPCFTDPDELGIYLRTQQAS